jgi:hypothetical protein
MEADSNGLDQSVCRNVFAQAQEEGSLAAKD